MIIRTVDWIFGIILQRIIHPAEIPLIIKSKSPIQRAGCHFRIVRRILRNHHDLRKFLLHVVIHALHEIDRPGILTPIPVSAPVDHVGNRINADSIHMIRLTPEDHRADQKGTHFLIPEIEVQSTPLALCVAALLILIQRLTIKVSEPVGISDKMDRNHIDDHADASLVARIDKRSELGRIAISGRHAEIAACLIAPGAIERIFGQRHHLDMRETMFFHIRNQILLHHRIGIWVFPVLFPASGINFIDGYRTIEIH